MQVTTRSFQPGPCKTFACQTLSTRPRLGCRALEPLRALAAQLALRATTGARGSGDSHRGQDSDVTASYHTPIFHLQTHPRSLFLQCMAVGACPRRALVLNHSLLGNSLHHRPLVSLREQWAHAVRAWDQVALCLRACSQDPVCPRSLWCLAAAALGCLATYQRLRVRHSLAALAASQLRNRVALVLHWQERILTLPLTHICATSLGQSEWPPGERSIRLTPFTTAWDHLPTLQWGMIPLGNSRAGNSRAGNSRAGNSLSRRSLSRLARSLLRLGSRLEARLHRALRAAANRLVVVALIFYLPRSPANLGSL